MGLFGGFKAKFTKDSTVKTSKSDKKDVVVCLGYRVYSEFDNPPQYLQASPQPSKPPAIRTVSSRPKTTTTVGAVATPQPSTSTPIETQIVTSPKDKKSSKKTKKETKNKHISTTSLTVTNSNTQEQTNSLSHNNAISISNSNIVSAVTTETVQLRNGGVEKESRSAPNSIFITGKTSSFNPISNKTLSSNGTNDSLETVIQETDTKPPKSILKQKTYVQKSNTVSNTPGKTESSITLTNNENIYSDDDYVIMASATSKTSNSNGYTTEKVDYMSATEAVTTSSSTQVATYVHTQVSSIKTDPTVSNNDYSSPYQSGGNTSYSTTTRSIGSTSNHAANIFFGGDEEPEVVRPRRANLSAIQSEEERRSSAEC